MSSSNTSRDHSTTQSFILIVIAASCIVAAMFGSRNSLSLTIEGINQSETLDYLQISFAFALGQLVLGAISPFAGMIADKYGSGKTLISGILLALLGTILIPYSTTFIYPVNIIGHHFLYWTWDCWSSCCACLCK